MVLVIAMHPVAGVPVTRSIVSGITIAMTPGKSITFVLVLVNKRARRFDVRRENDGHRNYKGYGPSVRRSFQTLNL
jgi:hypothetical protein